MEYFVYLPDVGCKFFCVLRMMRRWGCKLMRISSSTITRWQRRNINGPCGPVVVGRRPCESHYPTLLSLGGVSHLKVESHPSPNGLVFWGDWAFP
jgi:hypothetical protein